MKTRLSGYQRVNTINFHRFQFMKACYGELKVPNVLKTHSWTPDKVKSLSQAGDLYVHAFKPLEISDGQNTSDTSNVCKSQVSGIAYTPVGDSVCVCVCVRDMYVSGRLSPTHLL